MELMQRDSGAEAESQGKPTGDWRLWVTSPPHLAAVSGSVILLATLVGYSVAALVVFPPQDIGGDLRSVPRVIGMSDEEARDRLERAELGYEIAGRVSHPSAAERTVIAQHPLPGQRLAADEPVQVTLSQGPKLRPVPDVVGLKYEQANVALQQAGFATDIVRVDAEEPVDQVVSTRPRPGTEVSLPSRVRVVVSAGPPAVAIPDLVTRSTAEAREVLERLGLQLGSVSRDSSSLAAPGTVIDQSPVAGVVVERGTSVSVTVAVVPPPQPPDSANAPMPDTADSNSEGTDN